MSKYSVGVCVCGNSERYVPKYDKCSALYYAYVVGVCIGIAIVIYANLLFPD